MKKCLDIGGALQQDTFDMVFRKQEFDAFVCFVIHQVLKKNGVEDVNDLLFEYLSRIGERMQNLRKNDPLLSHFPDVDYARELDESFTTYLAIEANSKRPDADIEAVFSSKASRHGYVDASGILQFAIDGVEQFLKNARQIVSP